MTETTTTLTDVETYDRITEGISQRSAYGLANDAGCSAPDSLTSHGAILLRNVRDATVESIRYDVESDGLSEETVDGWLLGGDPPEIADAAPSVYTHTLWSQFVDLGAWNEDVSDYGDIDGDSIGRAAGLALYVIAHRLVDVIAQDVRDAITEHVQSIEDDAPDAT